MNSELEYLDTTRRDPGSQLPTGRHPSVCLEYLTPEYCKYSVDEKLIIMSFCYGDDKTTKQKFIHFITLCEADLYIIYVDRYLK